MEDSDQELLVFMSKQTIVIPAQVMRFLKVELPESDAKIRGLINSGWVLPAPRLRSVPLACMISPRGLDAIESDLPPPTVDLRGCAMIREASIRLGVKDRVRVERITFPRSTIEPF